MSGGFLNAPTEGSNGMRILVTGHQGYIGLVLVPMLLARGHQVTGIDSGLYEDCSLGEVDTQVPFERIDIRDVQPHHFEGVEAVVNLAALSNDPLGDLHPSTTHDINGSGAGLVAAAAKQAGVQRFIQSSTCSLYGAQGNAPIDETAEFLPVTPYGEAKVNAEASLRVLADSNFSPTYLRSATAYGYSPRVRGDLVVNNLVGYAMTTGKVFMKSDGTPWRPLVHIEDISRAFVAVLEAELSVVHDRAFNVGRTVENYQVRDVAAIVESIVPNSRIEFSASAGPDLRNYRVNCDLLPTAIPAFQPIWTVRAGVEQLFAEYQRCGLTVEQLESGQLQRVMKIKELVGANQLGTDLRWI